MAALELYSTNGKDENRRRKNNTKPEQWMQFVSRRIRDLGDGEPDNHEIHMWDKLLRGDVETNQEDGAEDSETPDCDEEQQREKNAQRPSRSTTADEISRRIRQQTQFARQR